MMRRWAAFAQHPGASGVGVQADTVVPEPGNPQSLNRLRRNGIVGELNDSGDDTEAGKGTISP